MKRKEKQRKLQWSKFGSMNLYERKCAMETLLFSICAKVYNETGLDPAVFYSACLTYIELFDKAPHNLDNAQDLISWLISELNELNAEHNHFSADFLEV